MKIHCDGIVKDALNIQEAREIINDLLIRIVADKKVVSHYLVDGIEIADINNFLDNKDDIKNIILVTRTIPEMIRDSIITFLDYLPNLQQGLMSLKEKLTVGETVSKEDWGLILDSMEWTNQLLISLSKLIHFQQEQLGKLVARWEEQLKEALSALETGDTVLVADILEFELLEILEECKSYFQTYLSQGQGE